VADESNDRPLGLFRRLRRAGQAPHSPQLCAHLDAAPADAERRTESCEEHTPADGSWVHLRLCLTCGHVGCCDSSRPRHATAHYAATGHPVMRSIEPGEDWRWCYVDDLLG
jgi:monovalent cation/hydrogen antiporter